VSPEQLLQKLQKNRKASCFYIKKITSIRAFIKPQNDRKNTFLDRSDLSGGATERSAQNGLNHLRV